MTRRAAVAGLLLPALLVSACTAGLDEPGVRPPTLVTLVARSDDRVVHLIRPGTTVTVVAEAGDEEGEPVDLTWRLAPGAGELQQIADDEVIWHTGSPTGGADLTLVVTDEAGGETQAVLYIEEREGPLFSGTITDDVGTPLAGARVEVNGTETRTDVDGYFRLEVAESPVAPFVVNVRREGSATFSQVFDKPVIEVDWQLSPAVTFEADPTRETFLQVPFPPNTCRGALSGRVDWSSYPSQRAALASPRAGTATPANLPADLAQALHQIESGTPCTAGFGVRIPANSLVDENGVPPSGPVQIELSTVDLYAPGSMPGDYTVATPQGRGYMESFGAGSIEISGNGKRYDLRPGAQAELTIPIDPLWLETTGGALQPTIPLLVYAEREGVWKVDGQMHLDPAAKTYVALVDHLSAFNADLVKTRPSCVRVDSSGIQGDYWLEAIVKTAGSPPIVRTSFISNRTTKLHAVYNLPNRTDISLRPFRRMGAIQPLGTFVVDTGGPQSPESPNPPSTPYRQCQARVALFEVSTRPKTPAIPTRPRITWQSLSSVRLDWTHDGRNVTGYHIYASNQSSTGPYYQLPVGKQTSAVVREVHPCRTYWFRVAAVNGNRSSALSRPVLAKQEVTAQVTVVKASSAVASPLLPGTFKIGCSGPKGNVLNGGIALYDQDQDRKVRSATGGDSVPFPRDILLREGRGYPGSANLIVYFRLSTYTTQNVPQFIAIYLHEAKDVVTVQSLLAGDLNRRIGGRDGVVMTSLQRSSIKVTGLEGDLPTASGPGFLVAGVTAPVFFDVGAVRYGVSIAVDFSVPLIRDDTF